MLENNFDPMKHARFHYFKISKSLSIKYKLSIVQIFHFYEKKIYYIVKTNFNVIIFNLKDGPYITPQQQKSSPFVHLMFLSSFII